MISTVANGSTNIPGGTGQFIAFQSATLDGANIAFVGNGPQTSPPPNNPAIRQPGLYTWNGTTSTTAVVLNQNDTVPEAWGPPETWAFEFFFTPAYDSGKIAFEGWQEPGEGYPDPPENRPRRHGLYLDLEMCDGSVDEPIKIIDTDDVFSPPDTKGFLDDTDIHDVLIGREGLDGDPPGGSNEVARVVFYVLFSAPPQQPEPNLRFRRAIYSATINETCPLP